MWPHCSGLGPRLREVSSPYVSSPPLCFSYEDTVIGFQLHTDNPGRPHLETLGHLQSRHFQARPRARVWAAASWEALGALGAGTAPCQGLSSGSRGEAAGSPALRAPLFPAGALKACDLDWPVVALGPHPGSSHSSSARLALWAAWWEPSQAPTGAALTQWGCGAGTRTAPRSEPAFPFPVTL